MPVSQTANNVQVAFKRQIAQGTPAAGSGAIGLTVVPGGQGVKLSKALVTNEAIRRDGQTARDRHGSRSGASSYQVQVGVGAYDDPCEAALRGTWELPLIYTKAAFTSITTTTGSIVLASGSALTLGIRVGDMIKLTGSSVAGNNGRWIRVIGVTAGAVAVPPLSLTLAGTADTGATITVAKTLLNGTTPVERYYTLEEFGQDIAKGLVGTDFKITKFELSMMPDKNVMATFSFMGIDVAEQDTSPTFPSPVYSVARPLVMTDGLMRVMGVDYDILTGFTLSWDMGGVVPPVLGSVTGPDVFLSNGKLSGSLTAIRQDMAFWSAFSDQTTADFFIVMRERNDDTAPFLSLYVGDAVLNGADAPIGNGGPMSVTVPWTAGIDLAGGDHAQTTVKMASSAA